MLSKGGMGLVGVGTVSKDEADAPARKSLWRYRE